MTSLRPPQAPPLWSHSAKDILTLTKEAIAKTTAVDDQVGALTEKDCNFQSVFLALAQSQTALDALIEPLSFYQNVSASKELREASNEAEKLTRDFAVEASMRLDVFKAKTAAENNIKNSGEWDRLSPEEQRLVEKMILDGKRDGLGLPESQRDELTQLKKELSRTCLDFNKNFNEEDGIVTFTLEELEGVPADVISGYTKRSEGSQEVYDVTFKTPDIYPLFKFAKIPATRQRATQAYDSRLAKNVPLFNKVIDLRRKIVKILGYPTWADHVTEVKMVKNARNVLEFLDEIEEKLKPIGHANREALLAIKKKEHEENGWPFDGEFYLWDYQYYDRRFTEQTLDLDDMQVKQYFPVSVVVPAILDIYQKLLGVRFEEINGETWHPDVQQFAVWKQDAKDESDFVGYCYLDLFPRASKYPHAAVWPLLAGYNLPSGKRSYPVAAMVANLAKPTPDKPALMRHTDVVTFFHEMGHVFHGLLSGTKFARFHGTNVAGDFVEAPSKMLEYWCWEPKVLERMSSHYETKEPLSGELIDKIVKSRFINNGLFYLRQMFYARFDIEVHTNRDITDYTALWNELRNRLTLTTPGNPTPGQGSFAHLMGGYDAGYYGYMYAEVFAADMYTTVFEGDPLNPARGARYSDKILRPGGSRDEIDSLKDFLGREPNSKAFFKELLSGSPPVSSNM